MKKKIAKYLIKKQWFINIVRLSLPDEKEINALSEQHPAGGGDAGWIRDGYKRGYIDGWNKKRTDIHLRKRTYKYKTKRNEA